MTNHDPVTAAILAQQRAIAATAAVTAAVDCPTCGSPTGRLCLAIVQRDTPPVPVPTTVPHAARMHAAGRACADPCEHCPRPLALVPSRTLTNRPGQWDTTAVLVHRHHRFAVGYVDPLGTARRTYGGPELPGPYAYAVPLPTVIEARPQPSTQPHIDVSIGTTLIIDGHVYQVANAGHDHIRLDPAPIQPTTPTGLRGTAADIAQALDTAFDHIDTAERALADPDDPDDDRDPAAGPRATLASMHRRLTDAITILRAVADQAEHLADATRH
ncbi:MAG: hypothetical protein JXA67_22190 [Micromonosporaceae bacterium]|nr:hypothetical protein [Micromonosporaceae bacterium]